MLNTVAVLIPCYNEEKTIQKVVKNYKTALPGAAVYVYDNNSTDATAQLAEKAGAIVRYEYRQGKGNVVRSMFRDIDADCYLITDGDDTYPAEAAPQMVRLILDKKADMVIGDRLSSTYFKENKRPFHSIGNRMVRGLINYIFGAHIHDIMTGCRALSRNFVKGFPVLSKKFEIETEMTVYAVDRNFLIREIPIEYRDRPEGSFSKLNTYSDGFKVLHTIFSLFKDYKPFMFFGTVSLLFLTFTIICVVPVLREYFATGLVPRFPTLIVGASCGVCAILSFFAGIILSVVIRKQNQIIELLTNFSAKVKRYENK